MNKKITNFMYIVLIAVLALVIFSPAFIKTNPVSADNHTEDPGTVEEIDPNTELPEEIESEISIKSGEDVVNYAMSFLEDSLTIDCTTTGTAVTDTPIGAVTQQVYGTMKVDANGNILVTDGSVKIAGPVGKNVYSLTYFDGNSVYIRETSNVTTSFNPNFTENWKTTSLSAYKEKYGLSVGEFHYIINNSTVKSYGTLKKKFIIKNNQKTLCYSTNILLDTKLSVTNYEKYVKTYSESTKIPDFSKLEMEFLVDKEGKLLSYTVTEAYAIKAQGFDVTINANMTTTYNDANYFLLEDPRKWRKN